MKKILCAAVLAGLAGAALAQGYVGALVGMSHYGGDCFGASNCDNSGTTGKIYGGYSESPNWALEVGYINFGEATGTVGAQSFKGKSSALFIGGAYRATLSRDWTPVLRLGIARVKSEIEPRGVFGAESQNKVAFYGGLGLEYAVTKAIKVVGGWDVTRFEVMDQDNTVHNFGLGAQFGF